MWHLKQIPKVVYFYWGGQSLPYLGYLSITSFIKHNPDWRVKFYYPKKRVSAQSWSSTEQKYPRTWKDYTDKIFSLDIEKTEVDFELWLGISNDVSEVHKSDFLRWGLLPDGGVWSDMDILYFAPMNNLLINTKENEDKTTGVSICEYGHSIGFLLSSVDNPYFVKMAKLSLRNYSPLQYQCIGCNLLNNVVTKDYTDSQIMNIGMDSVYYYNAQHVDKIYSKGIHPKVNGSVGCHWYAGHRLAGEFLNRTNGGLLKDNSVIGNLITDEN